MEMSQSFTRRKAAGFTLIEVLFAAIVLAVGLLALAALISRASMSTGQSRYMSTAGMLASEKLEQLSKVPKSDPSIVIPTGNSAGSLASNAPPVTINGSSVIYYDEVYLSSGAGTVDETISTGPGSYTTQTQTPNAGTPNPPTATTTTPPASADLLQYERRWIIENNVGGLPPSAKRITVRVTLANSWVNPQVSFQMSTVRQ